MFTCAELWTVQYVVLGPRVKVINLNILPKSSCNELKYFCLLYTSDAADE